MDLPGAEQDPAIFQTTAQPALGRKLGGGRFFLIRQLGRGGMGSVWLARDERLGEQVALKFLPQPIADDAVALSQLRRETLNAHKLSHPNIVRIYDLHEHPGEEPFIAMEFVDGKNLSQLRCEAENGTLTWEQLAPLSAQLCEALAYAHSQGVIHRDLKPANLLRSHEGQLKLADFGIAASLSNALTRTTRVAIPTGTIAYMSPQQINGEPPQPSDDIYSSGVTLYELLAGLPPFHSGEVLHQVLNKPAPLAAETLKQQGITSSIPPHVERTIMACLDKRPASRPANVGELQTRLASNHAQPTTKRSPSLVVVALALLAVLGVLFWPSEDGPVTPVVPESQPALPRAAEMPGAVEQIETPVPTTEPGRVLLFTNIFTRGDSTGLPNLWNIGNFASRQAGSADVFTLTNEAGRSFLRIESAYNKQTTFVERRVRIPQGVRELRLKATVRGEKVRRATSARFAGCALWLQWDSAANPPADAGVLGNLPDVRVIETNAAWQTVEMTLTNLPSGNQLNLAIRFGLNAASGQADLDSMTLEASGDAERLRLGVGIAVPKPAPLFVEDFSIRDPAELVAKWVGTNLLQSLQYTNVFSHEAEGDNRYLRMTHKTGDGRYTRLDKWIDLQPHRPVLEFAIRVRMAGLKPFPKKTAQFRPIKLVFADKDDNVLSYIVPLDINTQRSPAVEWIQVSRRIAVPSEATRMHMIFELYETEGQMDLDDIQLMSRM